MEAFFSSQRLALIGVGLIGGSLMRALRRKELLGEVVGVGRGEANLQAAKKLGVIDAYTFDVKEAVQGADMVVVATPVQTFPALFSQIEPHLSDECVVTDVGSVKGAVVEAAKAHLGARLAQFVPAHPIAGTEYSGVEASFAELFDDHRVILTPDGSECDEALARVTSMWQLAGASICTMGVAEHDRVLSVTSHLPHVVAYVLVNYLAGQLDKSHYRHAAGGFYDISRVASSDPVMWRDISLANKEVLAAQVRELAADFLACAEKIEKEEGAALAEDFARAKAVRGEIGEYRSNRQTAKLGQ